MMQKNFVKKSGASTGCRTLLWLLSVLAALAAGAAALHLLTAEPAPLVDSVTVIPLKEPPIEIKPGGYGIVTEDNTEILVAFSIAADDPSRARHNTAAEGRLYRRLIIAVSAEEFAELPSDGGWLLEYHAETRSVLLTEQQPAHP